MPIYQFECKKCAHSWDDIRKMGEDAPGDCPECASDETQKQLSLGNFHLRGRGWAIDGYSKGDK